MDNEKSVQEGENISETVEVNDNSLDNNVQDMSTDSEVVMGTSEEEQIEETVTEVEKEKKAGFLKCFGATIIDQLITVGVTYITVFLIGVILPSFGYKISNRTMMTLVAYIVINIFYGTIFNNKSIGKRILF